MMSYKMLLLGLFLPISATNLHGVENDQTEKSENRDRTARFKEIYETIQPVHVYGKVIDQNGVPVDRAEVKVVWYTAGMLVGVNNERHEKWVLTNLAGLWDIRLEKPWRAFVLDAKKSGFECIEIHDADHNLLNPRLTKENPVLIRLRKKGEESFLIRREGSRAIRVQSPHSQTNGLDLMAERLNKLSWNSYMDVQIAVNWLPNSNKWEMTLSAPHEADGLLVVTNLLYEAPQEGYVNNTTVDGPPWPQYVYLRSRMPPVYSRLDLECNPWGAGTNQMFGLSYKAWVNPYGERNLEYNQELEKNWRVEKELAAEAKAAIEAGTRPTKPDIQKRIQEMGERLVREKVEKERRLRQDQ
jgi:hypothetical protein